MQPEILEFAEKKLAGISIITSLLNNKTAELWRSFGLIRDSITDVVNDDLFSLQVYPEKYFRDFNPATEFEKWALTEVYTFDNLPQTLKTFVIPSGLYAVFHYKGNAASANEFFRYIFNEWLPASDYELEERPHFEILDERYKNNDIGSEEKVYIPVKIKP